MVISALNNTGLPNRQDLRVNRWAEWAQSFANRFQLESVHQQRMTLVLRVVHGSAANVSFVSRWSQFIQQLSPRIYLAVRCLLREIVLRRGSIPSSGVLAMPASWPSLHPTLAKPALTQEEGVQAGSYGRAMGGGISPVQRVFARASSAAEPDQLTVQRVNATTLLIEICHRVTRRAIELCERVEERRTEALILRREERVSSTVPSDAGSKDSTSYSPWGPSVGKPGFAVKSMHLPIDLDRLTDQVVRQIDHKILAHRERMGGIF